ncbi:MAG: alanine racemase [Erysipelotrichaceae bacterium]|nr:alanine racemase [Erysipelotrichaceae bacterium]
MKKTWIEIDLGKIRDNYALIKEKAQGALVCPVIKDNAYGHGAVRLAHLYEELGADYFAVSNIEEAMVLRDNGIRKPILILGFTPVDKAELLNRFSITQCVYSLSYARSLSEQGLDIRCHLKVDSGMNRIGFKDVDEMEEACHLPHLEYEGIFTHFSDVEDPEFSAEQFNMFMDAVEALKGRGIVFSIRHCANSGALFRYPGYHLDMVRPGIVLYGLGGYEGLKQALELKSVISHIKTVHKGEYIGYDRRFQAKKDTRVATVAIGYGDGYLRANSGHNTVTVNGRRAQILGNICMDQLMIDVSDIECGIYDEVLLYGDLEEIARNTGTISYELICTLNARNTVYYKD